LGRFWDGFVRVSALASLTFAQQLGLSKSTEPLLLDLSGRGRSGFAGQVSLSHWASCASVRVVTDECDEKSVVDKEFAACGSHVGMI
jgi:hypothetical protein